MNFDSDEKLREKQKTEIEFWRTAEHESPESNSIYNLVSKASIAHVLLDCLGRHKDRFLPADGRILELGGGQGWASCVVKNLYPNAQVIATDISEYAIKSLSKWEKVFDVQVDHSYACKSYETQEDDSSVDIVFCFAAAHHFLAHRRTLNELSRILKPGGKVFYFNEPSSSQLLYPAAFRRVNKYRPDVPEDILITAEISKLADKAGLDFIIDYYPSLLKRGPVEMIYYFVLSKLPFLQKILPCTANFIFSKKTNP